MAYPSYLKEDLPEHNIIIVGKQCAEDDGNSIFVRRNVHGLLRPVLHARRGAIDPGTATLLDLEVLLEDRGEAVALELRDAFDRLVGLAGSRGDVDGQRGVVASLGLRCVEWGVLGLQELLIGHAGGGGG